MGTVTDIGKRLPGEVIDTFYVPTDDIFSNEPATYLREFNNAPASGRGKFRYQEIHVLRDSYVATWLYNLGASWKFDAQEFQIIGGTVRDHRQDMETVDSIRECADWMRDEGGLRKAVDPETLTVTQEHYLDAVVEREKAQLHKSVYGRYAKVAR